MSVPSRSVALSIVALMLAPGLLAHLPGARASDAEAILSFERPEGYALGEVGDLMRLEGTSLVTQPAGTRWQLRVLDAAGGERGRQDFVGSGFSGHLLVQLVQGDPTGAWRGEARRLDGSSWVVLANVSVQVRLAPPPAAPGLSLQASENRVTATWTSDAVAPARYEVVVDDSESFASPEAHLVDAYDTTATFAGRWLTTYHVRVRVKDAYNEYSAWTESSVRTEQALRTVGFERNSYYVGPAVGDKLVAAAHAMGDAGAEWRLDVLDPLGSVVRSAGATGATVAFAAEVPLGADALPGQWKAEVWSRVGQEPWTLWQVASTQVAHPAPPGAPPLQLSATGRDVRAEWIQNGGLGRVAYDVQASRFADFSSPLLDLAGTTALAAEITGDWGATYHVRVRAADPYGTRSAWSVRSVLVDPEPLPDLVVVPESVWTVPSQLREGEAATAFVRVENRGLLAATTQVSLLLDGAAVASAQAALAAQGSATLSFPVAFPLAGERALQVRLDEGNLVREHDETNNDATRKVRVEPPPVDLEVLASDLDVAPALPMVGQSATIAVAARNLGPRASGPVTLLVTLGGAQLLRETVDVPAGGTLHRTLSWTPATPGTHELKVQADADRQARESVETNNDALRLIHVGAAPDLRVDAVSATPSSPFAGDEVQVAVTLRNAGSAGASSTRLALTARGPATILLDQDAPALEAGGVRTLTVSWRPPLAGSWTLEAVADAPDEVAETDEANNARSATLEVAVRPLPDVRVELVSPSDVLHHDTPTSHAVRVTNVGGASATDVDVGLRVRIGGEGSAQGVHVGAQRIPLLPPHESVVLSFPWRSRDVGPGAKDLALVANASTPGAEPSLDDNVASHPVRLLAPDLAIEGPDSGLLVKGGLSWELNPLEPSAPVQSVKIRNLGSLEAPHVVVAYDDGDGERSWVASTKAVAPGGFVSVDLPDVRVGEPGMRFVRVRAFAVPQAPLPDLHGDFGFAQERDLEPAVSRVDNTLQLVHVTPGIKARAWPPQAVFDMGAVPLSSDAAPSHALLEVEVFGESAKAFLEAPPKATSPWTAKVAPGPEGETQGAWGGHPETLLQSLSGRRIFHLEVPTREELNFAHCAGFRPPASCGSGVGGWSHRLDAGDVPGVSTGFVYGVGLTLSDAAGRTMRAPALEIPVAYEGMLIHLASELAPLSEGTATLQASVLSVSSGVLCQSSACGAPSSGFRVVGAADGAPRHAVTAVHASGELRLGVSSGFDFASNPVRIEYEAPSKDGRPPVRASSSPFWILQRAPALLMPGGQPQTLLDGAPALLQNGIHVLDAKVVGVGLKETDVVQAHVRLCYEPAKVTVYDDGEKDGWWGPDTYLAAQLIEAHGATCGPGEAAAYRSMPLTRDNPATFSFVVRALADALGTATFRATVFREDGTPAGPFTEPGPWSVTETLVLAPNPGGQVTQQLKDSLLARLDVVEATSDVALTSNDEAFLALMVDVGSAWGDVLVSNGWSKLNGKLFALMNDGKSPGPVGELPAEHMGAVDDDVVEGLAALALLSAGVDDALAAYTGTKRASVDEILAKYRAAVNDASLFHHSSFRASTAREYVYKLDVAENMLRAVVHKEGAWAKPSLDCVWPSVTPPQPGVDPSRWDVLCHGRPMHPVRSDEPVTPNLVAHYYTYQKTLLDDPRVQAVSKAATVARILALGATIAVPNPFTFAVYAAAKTVESTIQATTLGVKSYNFARASLAYPVGQSSVVRLVEQATPDPRCCTDYVTVAVAPGLHEDVQVPLLPRTLGHVATLLVPAGSPEPHVHAITAGGVPVLPTRVPVDGGVRLVLDVPADAAGNATIVLRGPDAGEATSLLMSISEDLGEDVRFVRLRVTDEGRPVPGLALSADVDGVPTPLEHVLGSAPEVRALQGSTLRVRASAPGYVDLDRTLVVDQPERFGDLDLDATPLVRTGVVALKTLAAGAAGEVALRVENPLATPQTLVAQVAGLPAVVVATSAPVTVPAGGAADLVVALAADSGILPGVLPGVVRIVDDAGETLREVPLRLTVTGAYAGVHGLPPEVDLVAGQSSAIPLTLRNAGNAELRDVQVALVAGPGWAVAQGAATTLAPGAEDGFELAFAPGGSQPASVTDAILRVTATGAPTLDIPVRLHLHKVDWAPARVVAARASDLDGDGAADAVESRAVGQSVFVGLRGASGEIGFEMLAHRVVVDGVTHVDTQALAPTHAKGVDETVSIWRTSEASLVRSIRPEGDGVVVRLVATAPGGKAPQVVTTYETRGLRDGDVLTGPWGRGSRAPALDLLAPGDLAPAELTQQDALGAVIRLRPVLPVDVRGAGATLGVFPVSGRVAAVFDDALLLEDASGGAWIETGGRPTVLPGDVVWANVRGNGSGARLVDLRVTGQSPLAPPEVDRSALLDASATLGSPLVDLPGTANVTGGAIAVTTATGDVPVDFVRGATPPPVTTGQAVRFRGVATAEGRLQAIPPFVAASASGALRAGWHVEPATVTLQPHAAVSTDHAVDGGPAVPYAGPFAIASDGDHLVVARAWDERGNAGPARLRVPVDLSAPWTTLRVEGPLYPGDPPYLGKASRLALDARDNASGVKSTTLCVETDCRPYEGPRAVEVSTALVNVSYWSEDHAGHVEATQRARFAQDLVPPTVALEVGAPALLKDGVLHATPMSVLTVHAEDAETGVAARFAAFDGGARRAWDLPAALALVDGIHQVAGYALDRVDNEGNATLEVAIDGTAPVTSLKGTAVLRPGTPFELAASDPLTGGVSVGVERTTWGLSSPDENVYAGPVSIQGDDGTAWLRARSTDRLGNLEATRLLGVRLDGTAPWAFAHVEGPSHPADQDLDGASDAAEAAAGSDPAERLSTPQTLEGTVGGSFSQGMGDWHVPNPLGAPRLDWVQENSPRRHAGSDAAADGALRLTGCGSGAALLEQMLASPHGAAFVGLSLDLSADAALASLDVTMVFLQGTTSFTRQVDVPVDAAVGRWTRLEVGPDDFGLPEGQVVPIEPMKLQVRFRCNAAATQGPLDVEHARVDNVRVFSGLAPAAPSEGAVVGPLSVVVRAVDAAANGVASGSARVEIHVDGVLVANVTGASATHALSPGASVRQVEVRAYDAAGNVASTRLRAPPSGA